MLVREQRRSSSSYRNEHEESGPEKHYGCRSSCAIWQDIHELEYEACHYPKRWKPYCERHDHSFGQFFIITAPTVETFQLSVTVKRPEHGGWQEDAEERDEDRGHFVQRNHVIRIDEMLHSPVIAVASRDEADTSRPMWPFADVPESVE